MSDDLISRSELTKSILSQTIMNQKDAEIMDRYLYCVQNAPTAYDIDKVVKELEENSVMRANSKSFYSNPQRGEYVDTVVLLNDAIEIVKDGGVDEK